MLQGRRQHSQQAPQEPPAQRNNFTGARSSLGTAWLHADQPLQSGLPAHTGFWGHLPTSQPSWLYTRDHRVSCTDVQPENPHCGECLALPIWLLLSPCFLHIQEAKFHTYCRPFLNPNLSDFCKNLTGIKQVKLKYCCVLDIILCGTCRSRWTVPRISLRCFGDSQNGWRIKNLAVLINFPLSLIGMFESTLKNNKI